LRQTAVDSYRAHLAACAAPDDSLPMPGQGQGHPRPMFTVRQGVARNCNNQSHAVLQA